MSRRTTKPAPTPASAPACPAPLLVSISGIRGIAGVSLDPMTVTRYTAAFARLVGEKRVVLGHDARPSARWILPLVEGVLRAHGLDVVFVGMMPTPTVGLLTRKLKAAGGIAVTASHNPIEYNGLKFFHSAGEFITHEMLAKLKSLVDAPAPAEAPAVGKKAILPNPAEIHLQTLLAALPPPARTRGTRKPRVIIDCCNSCGAEIAPQVADAYGAQVQLMNSDTSKYRFPRGPEPTPANISALRAAVIREGADLGFAIDPDADRLALVDEKGVAIGEERTLLLAADAYLSRAKRKTPLVVNLSTSMVIDELARRHKVALYRTAIGEANVMAGMRAHKARLGGEGNGGVILPAVQPGRDAATAIALVLIGLQERGISLGEWNDQFPQFAMVKESFPLTRVTAAQALAQVRKAFRGKKMDETDGLKVVMADRWLHVRPSNTEPIVRLFAEAPTEADAAELVGSVTALLGGVDKG